MRILVAEDDEVSRLVLRTHLANAGHEVLVAEDGLRAWEVFCESPGIDVVISDWMMPEMDGLELCRRVRETGDRAYPYFIFLTALGDSHLVQGLDAGADDYMTKPLDPQQLQARLRSADRVTSAHRSLSEQNGDLERLTAQLREQSRTDPLTGLGNRLKLSEDLDALTTRVQRYGHSYCMVLCDIDRFKSYNDHYGHQAGDHVLQQIATTILQQCRAGDASYRYGGEEFLVILPEQALSSGAVLAERLRQAIEGLAIPHELNAPWGVITTSVGVAAVGDGRPDGVTVDHMLRAADQALYRAKDAGRNLVEAQTRL
ncbi:GGDEF domain-containing response regulator [Nocardioides pacificus]